MTTFGAFIRSRREEIRSNDRTYSVRQLAGRLGVEPAYLSKIERDQVPPPSEEMITRLASCLGEDRDVLLALGGKVSPDLLDVIRKRPQLFADLLRALKAAPDQAILRVVREVSDGEW